MMDITVQKNTSVSLHSQIVTQFSMGITSGVLKEGSKLPSIRALSKKLGIHHNTCLFAYRELSDLGLIELQHGSGARVKSIKTPKAQPDKGLAEQDDLASGHLALNNLSMLAEFFVRQISEGGHSWQEAQAALMSARKKLSMPAGGKWMFVDLHADILPVFKAELEQLLQCPMETTTLADLETLDRGTCQSYRFIVSRYHARALEERLKAILPEVSLKEIQGQLIVIDLGSGQQELSLIHKLQEGSLIAIVSASAIILRQAEAVIRAIRGEEILIRSVLLGEEPLEEISKLSSRVKVIFSDRLCLARVSALTATFVQPVQTIPDHEAERLKALIKA